jgi:acyl carrier protein
MKAEGELLDLFSGVLRDLLGDDSIVLTMTTRRADIDSWDSFSYINFIATIEMELDVKFNVSDIESFEDVGAIVRRARVLMSPS